MSVYPSLESSCRDHALPSSLTLSVGALHATETAVNKGFGVKFIQCLDVYGKQLGENSTDDEWARAESLQFVPENCVWGSLQDTNLDQVHAYTIVKQSQQPFGIKIDGNIRLSDLDRKHVRTICRDLNKRPLLDLDGLDTWQGNPDRTSGYKGIGWKYFGRTIPLKGGMRFDPVHTPFHTRIQCASYALTLWCCVHCITLYCDEEGRIDIERTKEAAIPDACARCKGQECCMRNGAGPLKPNPAASHCPCRCNTESWCSRVGSEMETNLGRVPRIDSTQSLLSPTNIDIFHKYQPVLFDFAKAITSIGRNDEGEEFWVSPYSSQGVLTARQQVRCMMGQEPRNDSCPDVHP